MSTAPKARIASFAAATLLASATASADDRAYTLETPNPLATFDDRPPRTDSPDQGKFGEKGTDWWCFSLGAGYNFAHSTDWSLRGAWTHFVVRDVEFSMEVNGWYFDQPGDNALGINPAFIFRWHFINSGRWSVYSDAGIGFLITTDVVPERGTGFDFTPRVGGGFTYQLDDRGDRLQVGVRWHHISNARIEGDYNNPSRDALMVYTGIVFPF